MLVLAGLACTAGSAAPQVIAAETSMPAPAMPGQTEAAILLPTPTLSAQPIPAITIPPAIPEARRLTLEYPPKIRLGDTDIIRLTLEVDNLGNITPTAQIEGNVISGETITIPNLYETHNVTAQARLDLAGMQVQPSESIYEPLEPGQSITFYWSVRPMEAGRYRGIVWLTLLFVNKADSADVNQKTVSAQQVQIEATTFFGLKAGAARLAGGVGSLVGGILGFPFVDDILKWLWRRIWSKR
jgi:hypothetical protein